MRTDFKFCTVVWYHKIQIKFEFQCDQIIDSKVVTVWRLKICETWRGMKIQDKQFLICYTGDELLLNTISSKISFLLNPLSKVGTCKVKNEIETKRNRKRNEIKQNAFRFDRFRLISFPFVRFRFVAFLFRFTLYRYPSEKIEIPYYLINNFIGNLLQFPLIFTTR